MGAEKHYETQLQIGKSIMGKQKEELASQKSEIVHLKLEVMQSGYWDRRKILQNTNFVYFISAEQHAED